MFLSGARLKSVLSITTSVVVGTFALIFFLVIATAWPAFHGELTGDSFNIFSWNWRPTHGEFGILPMVVGSLFLATFSVIIAWPLALGLCSLLLVGETRRDWISTVVLRIILKGLIRFMTAVPTVIYAFAAVFLLVPLMRDFLGHGSGFGLITAGLVLAFLILPTMVLVMESGLRDRYQKVYLDSAALGFNSFQTLIYWVLPQSGSALMAALILGFGRGLGDTLISLMLAGGAPLVPESLTAGFRTLTAHLALVSSNEAGGLAYQSLYAAGALLLITSCGVSIALRFMTKTRMGVKR